MSNYVWLIKKYKETFVGIMALIILYSETQIDRFKWLRSFLKHFL